jgi:cytosine/adenosine deaminase-related metal-dependent hydrolase
MKTQNTAVTLFKGGAVITMDAAVPNIATGDVLVEGTRIAQLGANIQADGAEVIDASGSIVMPGLIDAHHHMWLGVARRMMPNVDDLAAYFELIGRKMGLKYRPLDMHLSTKLTALQASSTPATFRSALSIPMRRWTRWMRRVSLASRIRYHRSFVLRLSRRGPAAPGPSPVHS